MGRRVLLLPAVLLTALGLLTVLRAPTRLPWQLAVLVAEYGHFLALAAAVLAVAAVTARPLTPTAWTTAAFAVAATALLAKPAVQALRLRRDIERAFSAAFPPRAGAPSAGESGRAARTPATAESGGAARPDFEAPAGVALTDVETPAGPAPTPRRGGAAAEPPSAPFSLAALFAVSARAPKPRMLTYGAGLALDFYAAEQARGAAAPCVIVVHAGGWDNGDQRQFIPFNEALARRGFAVAAIAYRLAPQFIWPAQRDDVLAAIAFVKAHATELGIDPSQLVLFGRSAGGQLVEAVGYTAGDPAVRGVIALYAPADLEFAWRCSREDDVLNSPLLMRQYLGGTLATAPAAFRAASPIFDVTPRTPPTLLLHGQLDTLVWHKQSERLAAKLGEARVPHVFVSLPWATHAFDYNVHGPGGQIALWCVEQFIAAVTGS